jgi:hypothetical protein
MEVHPTPDGHVGGILKQTTAGLPNWAWLLIIAGGIAAAIILPKYMKPQSSSSSPSGLGLAIDPTNGLPYAVEGLVPGGGNAGASTPPPPLPQASAGNSAVTVRSQFSQPGVNAYDTANTGIPIRTKPDITSGTLRTAPFGSTIQVAGAPVTGGGNIDPSNPRIGSDIWYPVVGGGYISQFDLGNVGSTGPRWPQSYLRSRHYRVQA